MSRQARKMKKSRKKKWSVAKKVGEEKKIEMLYDIYKIFITNASPESD